MRFTIPPRYFFLSYISGRVQAPVAFVPFSRNEKGRYSCTKEVRPKNIMLSNRLIELINDTFFNGSLCKKSNEKSSSAVILPLTWCHRHLDCKSKKFSSDMVRYGPIWPLN